MTLIGWGSTKGVIQEAVEMLNEEGISANQLQIRWMVPLHGERIVEILRDCRHTIIVENNYSGQFARYLRSETSFVPNGHIRKYDGEPFMPHHIVEAVREQLAGSDQAIGAHARNHGVRRENMATTVEASKTSHVARSEGQGRSRLVPGLRRFRRAGRLSESARGAADSAVTTW